MNGELQEALLRQVGLYRSGQKTSLATCGTAMMIRKQDNTQSGRRRKQGSSDSTEEIGNHTEETQHGPSQRPPNIRVKQENRKNSNFRRDLNIVHVPLGISPVSNCSWPTFRNPVSVQSSKAGCRL